MILIGLVVIIAVLRVLAAPRLRQMPPAPRTQER
jgi:hypothetical protein